MLIRMEGERDKMEGLSVLEDINNRHIDKKKKRLKEEEKTGLSDTFSRSQLLKLESKLIRESNSIRV